MTILQIDPLIRIWRRTAVLTALVLTTSPVVADVLYPPENGRDRESEKYLAAVENYLLGIDLDDQGLVFHRLGGTTASNWSVERGGIIVANLKCTGGNTDHHGAVIAYRLGRELGFNIYPVAVYRQVNRYIDGHKVAEQCALKEWTSVFTQYYWTRDTFLRTDSPDKNRMVSALRCEHPKPRESDGFRYYARSAYGHPKIAGKGRTPYQGETTLLSASRDFSTMMVVDAVIGNEDRFPGGNTFFRSVTTSFSEREGRITFDRPRLYSLDNEAAFKGMNPLGTHSAKDLKDYVTRFDADVIAQMQRLSGDAGRLEEITNGDERLVEFIRDGIQFVLDRYAEAKARCGEAMATF